MEAHSSQVDILDGDTMRRGINAGLGYSLADRQQAVRRAGARAVELAREGHVVLVAMVSPIASERLTIRRLHQNEGLRFIEVWVSTPLGVCQQRDPKGLYRRAQKGELTNMTGIDSPYEPPLHPELVVPTHELTVAQGTARVLQALEGILPHGAGGAML